ncbi:MAG: sulfur carrier protein ThiS [Gammaproteobacteria bacterium]|nr:sulfur carrier protein ThiS [Gammaproteobacteria bacterium]
MQIIVNGNTSDVPVDFTAEQLIESLRLTGKRLAMEVNMEIVPRSTFESYQFTSGDRVEIVHAIGGG